MKKLLVICITVLLLAGLLAYSERYVYLHVSDVPFRTNRYTGQICKFSFINNPKWQPVPESVLATADSISVATGNEGRTIFAEKSRQTLTDEWNAKHNAGLNESIPAWVCQ